MKYKRYSLDKMLQIFYRSKQHRVRELLRSPLYLFIVREPKERCCLFEKQPAYFPQAPKGNLLTIIISKISK